MIESPDFPDFRLANLDIMRAFAALSVCAFHFRGGLAEEGTINHLLSYGYLGVDVFFVVSGFVIPLALHRSAYKIRALPRFLGRRFIRLYPAYFCACVLTLALWIASSHLPGFRGIPPHFSLGQVLGNFSLTADFLGEPWYVPVFWTLAIEAQYYVFMGMLFPLLTHRTEVVRGAVLVLWICMPLLLPLRATALPFFALFGMGIVFFLHHARLINRSLQLIAVSLAFFVQWHVSDLNAALAGLLSLCFMAGFRGSPYGVMAKIGAISYSIYLLHVPIGGRMINLAARQSHTMPLQIAAFFAAFFCTLVAAFCFFRGIEDPSHRFSRNLKRSR